MYYLAVLIVMIIVLQWNHKSGGYYELVEELGCHDTEFRLSCGPFDAYIAILEATFTQNDSFLKPARTSCGNPGRPPEEKNWKIDSANREIDFRHAINRRCSGVNYCSFILYGDHEAALSWGPGAVYLRYACMDGVYVTKSCNSELKVEDEGFVQTPGYPRYYVGGRTCHWSLKAPEPQKVKVTFLDVSLRGIGPHEKRCLDWLIVSEDGLDLLSTCGDLFETTVIRSVGSRLNVTLTTESKKLFPKRGLFFHYKAVGCVTPKKPQDGYLVSRNESFAHYRCCPGHVFPDTLSKDKTISCYNENTWDTTVPDCINASYDLRVGDNSIIEPRSVIMESQDSFFKDTLLPAIIMCVLFVGNGIILFVIYHHRKKLTSTEDTLLKDLSSRELQNIRNTPA